MSFLCYKKQRDRDFFQVCEQIRSENRQLSCTQIAEAAIDREAQSFYIDEITISWIIVRIRNGKCRLPTSSADRRELYLDLWNRYITIKRQAKANNSMMSIAEASRIISEQKAPRFYISALHAKNIYYRNLRANTSRMRQPLP
jgi:hypothetical protein